MQAYRDGFIHLLYAIILLQFVVIAVLLGGFSSEYISNVYFQAWINGNYPWLGSFLQGQVDALIVGMSLAATVLLIQRFRIETKLSGETPTRVLQVKSASTSEGIYEEQSIDGAGLVEPRTDSLMEHHLTDG